MNFSLAIGGSIAAIALFRGALPARKSVFEGSRRFSSEAGAAAGITLWEIIWNVAYAVRRARGEDDGWQTLFFIFGLPVTLLSWVVIVPGSNKMFGFDVSGS